MSFKIGTTGNATINESLPSITDGLVAHYTFDGGDVSATTINDVSGNGNNSTSIAGTPTPAIGKIGQAYNFNGTNDDAIVVDPFDTTSLPLTISAWARPTSFPQGVHMIASLSSSANERYQIYFGGTGTPVMLVLDGAGNTATLSSTGDATLGEWINIVLVVRSVTDRELYVNGASGATSAVSRTPAASTRLHLGTRASATSQDFFGDIDDVRVYNRDLSVAEITRLYNLGATSKINASLPSIQSGLVGWWTFDGADMDATTATDKSVSGNTATFTGTVNKTIGKIGQGVNLIGESSHLQLVGDIAPTFDGDFTVSMWVKPQDKSAYTATFSDLIGNGLSNTATGWVARFTGTQKFQVLTSSDASVPLASYVGSQTLPFNVWYHFAFTYNTTTGAIAIFVDGVEDTAASGTTESGGVGSEIGRNLWLGGGAATGVRDTLGDIDDIRIYSRILTNAEITRLYNLGILV